MLIYWYLRDHDMAVTYGVIGLVMTCDVCCRVTVIVLCHRDHDVSPLPNLTGIALPTPSALTAPNRHIGYPEPSIPVPSQAPTLGTYLPRYLVGGYICR